MKVTRFDASTTCSKFSRVRLKKYNSENYYTGSAFCCCCYLHVFLLSLSWKELSEIFTYGQINFWFSEFPQLHTLTLVLIWKLDPCVLCFFICFFLFKMAGKIRDTIKLFIQLRNTMCYSKLTCKSISHIYILDDTDYSFQNPTLKCIKQLRTRIVHTLLSIAQKKMLFLRCLFVLDLKKIVLPHPGRLLTEKSLRNDELKWARPNEKKTTDTIEHIFHSPNKIRITFIRINI